MELEHSAEYARVKRAYELGRLVAAAWRATLVTSVIGLAAWASAGSSVLPLLPLSWLAWWFAHWRGASLLRGAVFGLLGGSATVLLPMSVLRPCCDVTAPPGVDCCTMPGACLASGAVVGALVTALAPLGREDRWRSAAGVALGMTSVAILKCSALFAGEALGLVGGLLLGMTFAASARLALDSRLAA